MLLKYKFINQPIALAASACAKTSVAMFLTHRIMGPVMIKRQRFLYANVAIYALLTVVTAILIFMQYQPTRALRETVPKAKCWVSILQGGMMSKATRKTHEDLTTDYTAFSAYLDFLLALLPISIIWGLAFSPRRKFSLSILLGLGVL